MIAYLKGELVVKSEEYIIIEVQGIGYKVFMSKKSIDELQENRQVRVYTYLKVREDDISLFGFNTNEELRMFELLLSVSGIGAKSAITILSNISPSSFALAVISNDVNTLKKLPGIGIKSAQRVILELKDKLKTEDSISKFETSIEVKEAIKEDGKVTTGTGIGLALSRSLAELHQGSLMMLEGEEANVFCLSLPVEQDSVIKLTSEYKSVEEENVVERRTEISSL